MEKNHKPYAFFNSLYVRVFFCFSLVSILIYFVVMILLGRTIVPDRYLALNLAFPAIIWFFIGIAINLWLQKAGPDTIPLYKIALAAAGLIVINLAVIAIIKPHEGTFIPFAGNWLAINILRVNRTDLILRLPYVSQWHVIPMLLFFLFAYRVFSYHRFNTRLNSLFVCLAITGVLSGTLNRFLFGYTFSFINMRNYIDFGIYDIYSCVFYFAALQLLIFGKTSSLSPHYTSVRFIDYLKYEAANIKMLVSRSPSKTNG